MPAGLFAFTLACLEARRRVLGAIVFVLAMIGIVASYVRTAFVAVVVGAIALVGMLAGASSVSRRFKLVAVGLVVVVLLIAVTPVLIYQVRHFRREEMDR